MVYNQRHARSCSQVIRAAIALALLASPVMGAQCAQHDDLAGGLQRAYGEAPMIRAATTGALPMIMEIYGLM